MNSNKRLKGFSLAELLLGMALFALLIVTVATFSIDAQRAVRNTRVRVDVTGKIHEQYNALLLHKDSIWKSIVDRTIDGQFHLAYANNTYEIVDGPVSIGEASFYMEVLKAYRDGSGNLTLLPGTEDLHVRAIRLTSTWIDFLGIQNTYETYFYLSDWSTLKYEETTDTDFADGSFDMTMVVKNDDGEVRMQSIVYADWCNPSITATSYDLPGNGVAKAIVAIPGNAFMGTGDNASGLSFANILITPSDPPSVSVPGTYDGYKTNAIYGDGQYAYIATDTNSEEAIILNLASVPYVKVGYFDAPGTQNAEAVVTSGSYGYVVTGGTLYSFDLSSKSGSRNLVGSVSLAGTVTKLAVKGSYVFAAITGNTSTELQIVDITNPASMSVVGTANVTGVNAVSVFINSTNTRAYLATAASASYPEAFIIDITSKTGSRPIIGSYDTNGMNPADIAAPEGYPRMIIGGSGGVEQYQVVTTINESNPQYCGGIAVSTGVKGLTTVTESNGNVYSYFTTGNSSKELQIIKGGPGGGGADGIGYPPTATYISSIFDTTSVDAQYYSIEWGASLPASTSLKLQVKTNTTSDMSSISWSGPDGTSSTYYTTATGNELLQSLSGKQYFQYKVLFETGNAENTPLLQNVILTYQK